MSRTALPKPPLPPGVLRRARLATSKGTEDSSADRDAHTGPSETAGHDPEGPTLYDLQREHGLEADGEDGPTAVGCAEQLEQLRAASRRRDLTQGKRAEACPSPSAPVAEGVRERAQQRARERYDSVVSLLRAGRASLPLPSDALTPAKRALQRRVPLWLCLLVASPGLLLWAFSGRAPEQQAVAEPLADGHGEPLQPSAAQPASSLPETASGEAASALVTVTHVEAPPEPQIETSVASAPLGAEASVAQVQEPGAAQDGEPLTSVATQGAAAPAKKKDAASAARSVPPPTRARRARPPRRRPVARQPVAEQQPRADAKLQGWREARAEARALYQKRRYKEAARRYAAAAALNPQDAGTFAGLGGSHLAAGNYGAAAQAYARAVRLAPRKAAFRAALGASYERLRKPQQARAAYEAALSLDPNHKGARAGLRRLSK